MGKTETPTKCQNCSAFARSAFANLRAPQLEKLNAAKQESTYQRGDSFSVRNEPAEEVYCLRSGSAKVTLLDNYSGRQSLVRLVEPGEMLGYRCIFSSPTFRGTASALTDATACKISRATVMELIEDDTQFSIELLRRMGQEIANSEYHHHSFCQKNVRERLAEALVILQRKFGVQDENGWRIDTRLTRAELANWIGTSRETVIRGLSEFSQESLIDQIEDHVVILDLEGLLKVGHLPTKSSPQVQQTYAR